MTDVTVLTAAAALTDELAFRRDFLGDRLFVGDLRFPDVRFNPELSLHAVDDDLEMQLAHPADDRLARFFIRRNTERRIFLREPLKRFAELLLICLRLRLDRYVDNRLREHPSARG